MTVIPELLPVPAQPATALPAHELLTADGRPEVDMAAAERAAAEFLAALGVELSQEGLAQTPARMARAFVEFVQAASASSSASISSSASSRPRS